jgi:hypothetical protein
VQKFRVSGFGVRIQGERFEVQGSWLGVSGAGWRVQCEGSTKMATRSWPRAAESVRVRWSRIGTAVRSSRNDPTCSAEITSVNYFKNARRFRGRIVIKAHRLVYHSTPGWKVIKQKKKVSRIAFHRGRKLISPLCNTICILLDHTYCLASEIREIREGRKEICHHPFLN